MRCDAHANRCARCDQAGRRAQDGSTAGWRLGGQGAPRTAVGVVHRPLLGPVLDERHQRGQARVDGAVVGQQLGVDAGQRVVDRHIHLRGGGRGRPGVCSASMPPAQCTHRKKDAGRGCAQLASAGGNGGAEEAAVRALHDAAAPCVQQHARQDPGPTRILTPTHPPTPPPPWSPCAAPQT